MKAKWPFAAWEGMCWVCSCGERLAEPPAPARAVRTGYVCRGGRDLLTFILNREWGRGCRALLVTSVRFSSLYFVITEVVKTLQPDNSPRRKGRLCCRLWIFGISEDKI